MSKKRVFHWFVEPLNDLTWEAIRQGEGLGVTEENVHYSVVCSDGQPHCLIKLSEPNFRKVRASIKTHGDFRARYWRQEGHGQIEPWDPSSLHARRVRARKKVRKGLRPKRAAQK